MCIYSGLEPFPDKKNIYMRKLEKVRIDCINKIVQAVPDTKWIHCIILENIGSSIWTKTGECFQSNNDLTFLRLQLKVRPATRLFQGPKEYGSLIVFRIQEVLGLVNQITAGQKWLSNSLSLRGDVWTRAALHHSITVYGGDLQVTYFTTREIVSLHFDECCKHWRRKMPRCLRFYTSYDWY